MVVITHYAPLPQHTSPQQPKTRATSVSAWTARIWLWWACPHAFWVTLCVARTATLVTFSRTGQHVEPGQRSTIRAASPLSQHVTSMPPTGLQSLLNLGQDTGPHAPPGASRPSGAHPYMYSNGDKRPSTINGQTCRLTHARVTKG